jgi:hypothetical protein
LSKLLPLEDDSSGQRVEYQSCRELPEVLTEKVSAQLGFCSPSYRQNTIARSAKNNQNREARMNFSTIETIELASVLSTKVVGY